MQTPRPTSQDTAPQGPATAGGNAQRVAHIGWLASSHLSRRAMGFAGLGLEQLVLTDAVPPHLRGADLPFRVELLPSGLRSRPLEAVAWVEEKLAAFGADVLHIHSTHFPAVLGMFCRTTPRIASIWDFVYSRDPVSPLWHRGVLEGLFNGPAAEAVSFSSKVIMDQWLDRGMDAGRARFHSWGLDPEVFAPRLDSAGLDGLRAELGIAPDERVIFCPRTPSLPANVDMVLRALPRLRRETRCLLTGHVLPPETRYLEPLLNDPEIASRLTILEPVRDASRLAGLYQLADAVTSPHCNDNNPATVLEAMACGAIPVVAASSSVEYWARPGVNGFVAPPRDLDGLVETLDEVLDLPRKHREEMGRANRARIVEEANFPRTLRQVTEDYADLAGRGCRRGEPDELELGLLHDACGLQREALEHYSRASAHRCGSLVHQLAEEKRALLHGDARAFHAVRFDPAARSVAQADSGDRAEAARDLSRSMHLFAHDQIAGLYPLAASGDVEEYLDCLRVMERTLHVHHVVWVSESVAWFGGRWSMWDFCADLLLAAWPEYGCLTRAVADTLAALPEDDGRRPVLARLARACGSHGLEGISPDLDRRFRREPLAALDG